MNQTFQHPQLFKVQLTPRYNRSPTFCGMICVAGPFHLAYAHTAGIPASCSPTQLAGVILRAQTATDGGVCTLVTAVCVQKMSNEFHI